MPEKYTGMGGGGQDLLRYDTIDISLAKTWCLSNNRFD